MWDKYGDCDGRVRYERSEMLKGTMSWIDMGGIVCVFIEGWSVGIEDRSVS